MIEDVVDVVARRIVMPRKTWDTLVRLADALRSQRGIEVTPTDVASIAVESGLAELRMQVSREAQRKATGKPRRRARKA